MYETTNETYTKIKLEDRYFIEIHENEDGYELWIGHEYYPFKMSAWTESKKSYETGDPQSIEDIISKTKMDTKRIANVVEDFANIVNNIPDKR